MASTHGGGHVYVTCCGERRTLPYDASFLARRSVHCCGDRASMEQASDHNIGHGVSSGGSRIFIKGMRNRGSGGRKSPTGSRGGAPVGVWGEAPRS